MSSPKTLQSYLSASLLRELAGPKVYMRGSDYYEQNCVDLLEHSALEAVAEVEGSHPYRVELKLTPKGLEADCTCPAMSDYGFCKHAVAFGLFLIDAPQPSGKKKSKGKKQEPDSFSQKYPNIADWVQDGWIEIGRGEYTTSTIRVLDEGGLVWEGGTRTRSIDAMLEEAEQAIIKWNGG
jgi:SWIM zinc finger